MDSVNLNLFGPAAVNSDGKEPSAGEGHPGDHEVVPFPHPLKVSSAGTLIGTLSGKSKVVTAPPPVPSPSLGGLASLLAFLFLLTPPLSSQDGNESVCRTKLRWNFSVATVRV